MEVKPVPKKAIIGISIFAIVSGILFCFLGKELLYILFTILGALVLAGGVFALIETDVIGGVLGIAIGVLMITGAWLFVDVLLIINGVLLCISGLFGLFVAIKTEDSKGCLYSALTLVLGILFFITKLDVINWIFFVIGALLIVSGIIGLITSLVHKKDKTVKTVDVKDIK